MKTKKEFNTSSTIQYSAKKRTDKKAATQLPELINIGDLDSGLKTSRNVGYVESFSSNINAISTDMRKSTQNAANSLKEYKTQLPKIDPRKMSLRIKDPEFITKIQQRYEGKTEKGICESISERSEASRK